MIVLMRGGGNYVDIPLLTAIRIQPSYFLLTSLHNFGYLLHSPISLQNLLTSPHSWKYVMTMATSEQAITKITNTRNRNPNK